MNGIVQFGRVMFTNIFAPELTRQRYSFALRRMQMVLIDIKMHHQLTHYLIEDIQSKIDKK